VGDKDLLVLLGVVKMGEINRFGNDFSWIGAGILG
jgi:hypothetical protein